MAQEDQTRPPQGQLNARVGPSTFLNKLKTNDEEMHKAIHGMASTAYPPFEGHGCPEPSLSSSVPARRRLGPRSWPLHWAGAGRSRPDHFHRCAARLVLRRCSSRIWGPASSITVTMVPGPRISDPASG